MPDGGTLRLTSALDSTQDHVAISVSDTGPGIPEKNLAHVFEPFFTTKGEGYGLGLGLSTVYGIMERHRGTVEVESKSGQGTAFKLRVPVYRTNQ